jgi:chromosome segregation ATPase
MTRADLGSFPALEKLTPSKGVGLEEWKQSIRIEDPFEVWRDLADVLHSGRSAALRAEFLAEQKLQQERPQPKRKNIKIASKAPPTLQQPQRQPLQSVQKILQADFHGAESNLYPAKEARTKVESDALRALEEDIPAKERNLAEREAHAKEEDDRLRALHKDLTEKERNLNALDEELMRKASAIASREAFLRTEAHRLSALQQSLTEKEDQIAARELRLREEARRLFLHDEVTTEERPVE